MSEIQSRTTMLADLAGDGPAARTAFARFGGLLSEAFLFTCVGLLLTAGWRGRESGVIAMFLSAAAMTSRIKRLLEENRTHVYAIKTLPLAVRGDLPVKTTYQANLLTVMSVLGTFSGVLAAFVASTALVGPEEMRDRFALVVETADLGSAGLLTHRFGSTESLIVHNFGVLASVLLLGFVYRSYGLALILVWNACTWGLVLTLLVMRSMGLGGVPAAVFVPVAAAGLLPHLMLEALAYVLAGLAAAFVSQAVMKYKLADLRLKSTVGAASRLLLAAILALAVGAVVESILPAFVLARLA